MTAFWGDQGNISDCLEMKVVNYAAPHEQNEAEVGIFFSFIYSTGLKRQLRVSPETYSAASLRLVGRFRILKYPRLLYEISCQHVQGLLERLRLGAVEKGI